MKEVKKNHKKWLQQNKHLRYMWIPHTDAVVVVHSNPLPEGKPDPVEKNKDEAGKLKPMNEIYNELLRKHSETNTTGSELPAKTEAIADVERDCCRGQGPNRIDASRAVDIPCVA